MNRLINLFSIMILVVSFNTTVYADPGKDESGKGWKNQKKQYKEAWKREREDAKDRCEYERERKKI